MVRCSSSPSGWKAKYSALKATNKARALIATLRSRRKGPRSDMEANQSGQGFADQGRVGQGEEYPADRHEVKGCQHTPQVDGAGQARALRDVSIPALRMINLPAVQPQAQPMPGTPQHKIECDA